MDVDLLATAERHRHGGRLTQKFFSALKDGSRIVDLGGRARSGRLPYMDHPAIAEKKDISIVTFDIVEQDGVDVVGDAHEMSRHFQRESLDAVMSVSVFEHLLMPWKVALEMNAVLKTGGYALVHTHQTIGLHDCPWDYWRFSEFSWKAIFNRETGFEIVDVDMGDLMHIVSFYYADRYRDAERSAGFESSTVLVRKIGQTKLSWSVSLGDVVDDHYPTIADGNFSS